MTSIDRLQEFDRLARLDAQRYPRHRTLVGTLLGDTARHATGVVGPRGVGKTVVLRQLAVSIPDSFYLSADTLESANLFDIVKRLHETMAVTTVLIDEIHFQSDYARVLKQVYDLLPVKLIFTSSVSLSLLEAAVDLSRRVRVAHLLPFTFREFVLFKTGQELAPLSLQDIESRRWTPEHIRTGHLFEEYLRGGLMPFALEEPDPLAVLRAVLDKIVTQDVPLVGRLQVDEIPLVRRCLEFIGRSSVDGVNYSSLSRNVGITKYKAESYTDLLRRAFVLNPLLPKGANVSREPKILMCVPFRLLFGESEATVGGLREDFLVEAVTMHGAQVDYLKSTRGAKTPDYVVQTDAREFVIEVGGKGKGRQQFKGYDGAKSMILTPSLDASGIRRPLFMAGFLEPHG